MLKARISRPDKNAMQSGVAKSRRWLFEYVPEAAPFVESLMGWTGMTDMPQQIRLFFPTKDAAIAYAKSQRLEFEVLEPHARQVQRKSYADNFKFDKPVAF